MDAFFVVEELFDPSLKGKPVVVGGQRHERGGLGGIYEARRSAPLYAAAHRRQTCPQLFSWTDIPTAIAPAPRKFTALESFSPQVEMVSPETYRMTGTNACMARLLAAHKLLQRMKAETQLNCSIGIGSSRLIAKVCSNKAKPHGVLYVVPGRGKVLAPLEVRDIPGVGK
jgi:DNA polymerase-4